jgi:hypothetical protein
MTSKIYKTAQGKSIDLGTIMLQNSHVRAVGNMNVNARGDVLDGNNKVIQTKNRQIQQQNNQQTVRAPATIHTSTRAARRAKAAQAGNPAPSTPSIPATPVPEAVVSAPEPAVVEAPAPVAVDEPIPAPVAKVPAAGGGLAAAIARSKVVKQEKEKTARQLQQEMPGVRKI